MDFSICDHTVGFPKYSHILAMSCLNGNLVSLTIELLVAVTSVL